MAQGTILSSQGQGGQDAGIVVIPTGNQFFPGPPVTLEWTQSISFADVSIFAGLISYDSSATGWATLSSGSGQIAAIDFDYPVGTIESVNLFNGLNLSPGNYNLSIGNYSGDDAGWGLPAEGTLYAADNVAYRNTISPYGPVSPLDFTIVSVPEPPIDLLLGSGLLAAILNKLRIQKTSSNSPLP